MNDKNTAASLNETALRAYLISIGRPIYDRYDNEEFDIGTVAYVKRFDRMREAIEESADTHRATDGEILSPKLGFCLRFRRAQGIGQQSLPSVRQSDPNIMAYPYAPVLKTGEKVFVVYGLSEQSLKFQLRYWIRLEDLPPSCFTQPPQDKAPFGDYHSRESLVGRVMRFFKGSKRNDPNSYRVVSERVRYPAGC